MKKYSCMPINHKKYSCYGLKKNSYKEFDKEKKFLPPPPPIIFLMVYTLGQTIQPILY